MKPTLLPARYFPIEKGVFEVAPNLRKLGSDFGNGVLDVNVFQVDCEYERYRNNKNLCRQERLSKYYCQHEFSSQLKATVSGFGLQQLAKEYPEFFSVSTLAGCRTFTNHVVNERITEQGNGCWFSSLGHTYDDAFDMLATQLQEDLAVMTLSAEGKTCLVAAHVCAAGNWAPEEKIGHDFLNVHKPIPGSEAMNSRASALVQGILTKGPFVRFTWGLYTDTRLNHHSEAPIGVDPLVWKGAAFNPQQPKLFLRVERQVMIGFEAESAFLFTIRPLYQDFSKPNERPAESSKIAQALKSMSPEQRVYKGVSESFEALRLHLLVGA